ncbi:RNA polymerase III transcription factor IIIC subunit-domain-containing protein [Infundibulicybe gibba]|nr:RNA polymerase III transcription factor IIIC subunit-domain-containing protein [Infundibulicybe gibba]
MDNEPSASNQQYTFHSIDTSDRAPDRALPKVAFYSVEYPGYVKEQSVPLAIQNLGGQTSLDNAFRRAASKTDAHIEVALRPGNPFAHPIPGDVVPTNNILLKITKKRRKRRDTPPEDGAIGEYTVEAVGVINKTARFRSMVDYQYQPDMEDPISKLRISMEDMDVDALCKYTIPKETGEYMVPASTQAPTQPEVDINLDPQLAAISQPAQAQGSETPLLRSNLRLFPPPLFSRQTIPLAYNFKSNPASIVSTTIDEETGEEKKRLINRMRWKGYGPASVTFNDTYVPEKPPQNVESGRDRMDQRLLVQLQALFLERPVWTRMSLFNQFPPLDAREIHNSKILLPLVCYVFQDGPWRDTLIRFSYDPRKDNGARFYQRLYFRNANHPISRPSVMTRRQERATNADVWPNEQAKEADRKQSHIFDGQTLTKETAAFQLCDITDPMLKELINDPKDLRDVCHERDGWYDPKAFERIKAVLRHKFFSLLEGHVPTDEECQALMAAEEGSTKTKKRTLKAGKHNMAKGALRPEDAAAQRLRATLERNAKTFQSQRQPL